MAANSTKLNLAFGSLVAVLAAVAGISMYRNMDLPPIRAVAPSARMPENHPPIESGSKIGALEDLSSAQPQNAELKTQVGNAYYDMGQFQKAAAAYEESLKLKPGNAAVETDLATCYHFTGQSDRALETFDRVLQYQPGFPQALFNKGVVLQAKNDPKGAIAAWEDLLRTNPSYPQKADLEQRIAQLKAAIR
jgi:tetratricopeptide (TPR) repeat protein